VLDVACDLVWHLLGVQVRDGVDPLLHGGVDIHRKQLTFDYADRATGELLRAQIAPADRRHLAVWLRRFDGVGEVALAVEGCTGWRYVVEELQTAGVRAYLAEPGSPGRLSRLVR
jgi:hypothetical protein